MKNKTFHIIGMPHLPISKKYKACAFTNKIHGIARMILDMGHSVFLYGVGYTDIEHENLRFFPVVDLADIRTEWGSGDNRFEVGYNWKKFGFRHDINSPASQTTLKFREKTIEIINQYKADDHFLLLSQGVYQKPIANAVKLFLTIEPLIGYRGSYSRFRAFESSYIQNFTYGSEHPRKSINGNYYDRVIPNYLDPDDFIFGETPDNVLAYCGRIIVRKGIATAMKVADYLDIELLIAGQGSMKDIPYKSPRARHIGTLDADERKLFMAKTKVGFLPTLYLEPFGTASIEFMYSGAPMITTNFGVFPETIRNGVGGYRCDTLNDFVENTKKALYLDRSIVRDYAERFTMETIAPKFNKWFSDLYMLYQSTMCTNVKAWHFIKEESNKTDKKKNRDEETDDDGDETKKK